MKTLLDMKEISMTNYVVEKCSDLALTIMRVLWSAFVDTIQSRENIDCSEILVNMKESIPSNLGSDESVHSVGEFSVRVVNTRNMIKTKNSEINGVNEKSKTRLIMNEIL